MTEHRTSEEIERQLEKDRAGLADTLDDLKDRFSLDTLVRQTAEQIREHGGDIGASVSQAVKSNPIALALTGVGLAWLMMGDRSGSSRHSVHTHGSSTSDRWERRRDNGYPEYGATADHTAATSAVETPAPSSGYSSGYSGGYARGSTANRDIPAWARDVDDDHFDDSQQNEGSGIKDKAKAGYASVAGRAAQMTSSARDGMRDRASRSRDRMDAMRQRLSEGTEHLSDEGRARVIAARERVHKTKEAAMVRARKGQDRATDLFEEQPLIAGALALAIGAAIGAALPRTRYEDEYFGEQSDALIHEAERIFEEERAKVTAVAGAAMDEARDIAKETRDDVENAAKKAKADADRNAEGETLAQDVADKAKTGAKEAGQRIADRAKSEAERQNLGKPKT